MPQVAFITPEEPNAFPRAVRSRNEHARNGALKTGVISMLLEALSLCMVVFVALGLQTPHVNYFVYQIVRRRASTRGVAVAPSMQVHLKRLFADPELARMEVLWLADHPDYVPVDVPLGGPRFDPPPKPLDLFYQALVRSAPAVSPVTARTLRYHTMSLSQTMRFAFHVDPDHNLSSKRRRWLYVLGNAWKTMVMDEAQGLVSFRGEDPNPLPP